MALQMTSCRLTQRVGCITQRVERRIHGSSVPACPAVPSPKTLISRGSDSIVELMNQVTAALAALKSIQHSPPTRHTPPLLERPYWQAVRSCLWPRSGTTPRVIGTHAFLKEGKCSESEACQPVGSYRPWPSVQLRLSQGPMSCPISFICRLVGNSRSTESKMNPSRVVGSGEGPPNKA